MLPAFIIIGLIAIFGLLELEDQRRRRKLTQAQRDLEDREAREELAKW